VDANALILYNHFMTIKFLSRSFVIFLFGMYMDLSACENTEIIVGSQNQIKLTAVNEVVADYARLSGAKVVGVASDSGIREQPLSLEETVKGAKNRAENAYAAGSLSIGLESGLILVPETDSEYMDVCICSVYDGEKHHIGMSCGFRLPKPVSDLIISEGLDLNQAMQKCGFTHNPRLGAAEGSVGLFTSGRICRKDYCKQSLVTALISVENSHFFESRQPITK
jgi:inosine/xanthosine triphosphatase